MCGLERTGVGGCLLCTGVYGGGGVVPSRLNDKHRPPSHRIVHRIAADLRIVHRRDATHGSRLALGPLFTEQHEMPLQFFFQCLGIDLPDLLIDVVGEHGNGPSH